MKNSDDLKVSLALEGTRPYSSRLEWGVGDAKHGENS